MAYGTVQLSCTRAEMLKFACANPTLTRESFLVGEGVVVPPPPEKLPVQTKVECERYRGGFSKQLRLFQGEAA